MRTERLAVSPDSAGQDVDNAADAATADGNDVAVPVEPQRSPGAVARFFSEIPLAVVIAVVGVGLLVIAMHHFRWGDVTVAAGLLAAALLRAVLPTRRAGLLAVRSRFVDIVTTSALGGALLVLALITKT